MQHEDALNNLFGTKVGKTSPVFTVYTEILSPRLEYVCGFIFNRHLRSQFRITNKKEVISKGDLVINYSRSEFQNAFQIVPSGILTGKEIPPHPDLELSDGSPVIYPSRNGDMAFDLFAAVFYFISRAEEWQPFKKDEHGRFEARESFLFRHDLHLKPVVDIWVGEFKKKLKSSFPSLNLPEEKFRIVSTIDVDNLYAFRYKGLVRTAGASFRDLLNLDFFSFRTRLRVLRGLMKDPFDIYETVSNFCHTKGIPLIYFFLYRTGTRHDRTVDPASGIFKKIFELVRSRNALVGIHPSYDTSLDQHLIGKEIRQLSEEAGEMTFSRQHYLRFNIRTTPNQLFQNGIRADFTMGFATKPGFRAGTSYPFYYYDFTVEQPGGLLLVPFCAMDGVYTVYGKTDPEKAYQELISLASEIKKAGGYFITVFHERTFFDHLYKGYGTLYKKLHEQLKA